MVKTATRILLIEDEAIVALIATRAMRAAGYSVDRASGGEEALKLFALNDYDLVVSDVELGPGMDGIATAEAMLKSAAIPILFLTSHARGEVDRRAKAIAGNYDYLKKDADESLLASAIELCLQRGRGHLLFDYIEGKVGSGAKPKDASDEATIQKQREHLRFMLRSFSESGKPYARRGRKDSGRG